MKKILCFVDEIYEDLELWYPKIRLEEEGHQAITVGHKGDHIFKGKYGYPCKSDISFDTALKGSYDGILIPGGFAPDKLRRIPQALELVRQFNSAHRLIAFICHAGWVPISAKILKGRAATSTTAIKDDMENAGVIWSDEAVVVDKNLVSARTPADLVPFAKAMLLKLSE